MMCSKSKHFILSCEQFMMSRDSFKRQLKYNNGNFGLWQHNSRNCLLLTFCTEHRQSQAEIKIFNLLKHNAKSTCNIYTDRFCPKAPTDAQIIFGNCNCEKLFCKRGSCRSRWNSSRIQWLWELEQQPWEQPSRRNRSSDIELNRSTKVRQNARNGCWSWLLRSCGYASDTESLDVPFNQRYF